MTKKRKITAIGEPCRKCGTPVVKRVPKLQTTKAYRYNYYLYCEPCDVQYMINSEKVMLNKGKR